MTKRGQNEGSIYKRSDGRWVAVANLGYRNGKRWRKSFYGKTRKEVQEQLTSALNGLQAGQAPVPEKQSVGQFLDYWLEHSAKQKLRPRTYVRYEEHIRLHIKPTIGRTKVSKLTPQEVEALLNEKIALGLAPSTVRYTLAILRRSLGQALRWGQVARNVATLVDSPRVKDHEIEPLNPKQAQAFLKSIIGDRLEALYSVALAVGLRKGEALGLRWDDVDLEKGFLTVRWSLQRINGKLSLTEPKSRNSKRAVALPQIAVTALRRHRAAQLQERLLAGSKWHEGGYVFPSTIGTPMDTRNLTRHFNKALEKAGLSRIRFHDLRHTCASLLLAQGIHPRVVMEILGHSQFSLTMNTYSHVIPELQQEAADQMDALLGT